MFWYLFLAHLLADFPLQPNWIVINKNKVVVLSLHVTIHFLVGLVFISFVNIGYWPYVVLLAFIHFLIDLGKNHINNSRPDFVVAPYFIDQLIHIASIILISILIANRVGVSPFTHDPIWLKLLIIYLLVTYVWYITERIITFKRPGYFNQVVEKAWSRMLARGFLLSAVIIFGTSVSSQTFLLAGFLSFPYHTKVFGIRAMITDILVSISGALFFFWLI